MAPSSISSSRRSRVSFSISARMLRSACSARSRSRRAVSGSTLIRSASARATSASASRKRLLAGAEALAQRVVALQHPGAGQFRRPALMLGPGAQSPIVEHGEVARVLVSRAAALQRPAPAPPLPRSRPAEARVAPPRASPRRPGARRRPSGPARHARSPGSGAGRRSPRGQRRKQLGQGSGLASAWPCAPAGTGPRPRS